MSETDRELELMRRGLDAFSRGAFDEALADTHPEIEWHLTFHLPDLPPEKRVFHGHEQVRDLWEGFTAVWDPIAIEVEEVIAAKPGTIAARTRFRGRGTGSGAEADRVVFYVFTIEDGLLRSLRPFDTEAEALETAGLERGG